MTNTTTATEPFRLAAQWTPDCQGKWDYDAPIISLSTRYWPRGGGFTILHRQGSAVTIQENSDRPDIKPSAHASIIINFMGQYGGEEPESYTLCDQHVEAETETEAKAAIEQWAQQQMDRIVAVLRTAFP